MRYKLLTLLDKLRGKKIDRCLNCGRKLTAEEYHYYDGWCENCEKKWLERINK